MAPLNRAGMRLARLLIAVVILMAVVLAYTIIGALHTLNTTGVLRVISPNPRAIITISQTNSDAEIIGTGTTTVRLYKGSYLIGANYTGSHAVATSRITVGKTTRLSLSFKKDNTRLPSADNIDFEGLDSLANYGLTTDQIANLKQLFFNYNKSIQRVNIDTTSVRSEPHDPASDAPFQLDFSGAIDGVPYKAVASYTDLTNIQLTLDDSQTGGQLFAGESRQSSPDN